MVLSDSDITRAIEDKHITILNFSNSLEPASYDMRVGDMAITKSERVKVEEAGQVVIPRGETAVIYPMETVGLDETLVARFGLVSKCARRGLILLSGPQIDPGYHGRLEVTVFNCGNSAVHLAYGEKFVTIEFDRLSTPASRPYDGPYQGRSPASGEILETVQTRKKSFAEYEQDFASMKLEVGIANTLHQIVITALVLGSALALTYGAMNKVPEWLAQNVGGTTSNPLFNVFVLGTAFGLSFGLVVSVVKIIFRCVKK
jgi:dCTP deaminase